MPRDGGARLVSVLGHISQERSVYTQLEMSLYLFKILWGKFY